MADPIAVLERLLDTDQWPTYRRKGHSQLGSLAREAYERKTYDGYLSYVLITSQECEDYARILLKEAQFTLQICLAMRGFGWEFPQRETGQNLEKLMFGQILELLERSMDFTDKREFIDAVRKLSQQRNKLAHELDTGVNLQEIEVIANTCIALDEEITSCFNNGDDDFSYFFTRAVHDTGWDDLLQRRLGTATPEEKPRIEAVQVTLAARRERW